MSMKSIIILTSLFLVVSSQNNITQAGFMAGDTDEGSKMEMGQSMREMQALISEGKVPLLREQENQEKPDIQSNKLAVASNSSDNEDITGSLFKKMGVLPFTDTILAEMVQNTILQPFLEPATPLLMKNALVDEVTIQLMSKAIGFSPASKSLGEKIEKALEHYALTLGKFAPYETLD